MWKTIDTLTYFIPPNFNYSKSVAVFSLFNTLLRPSHMGLKYWSINVKERLQELYKKNASIIVIHTFDTDELDMVKGICDKMLKDLNIPVMFFFATKRNKYSKPFTNIWILIELFYKKANKTINKQMSIYVGNSAGRIKNVKSSYRMYEKCIDKSCVDRAFAHNIGLVFITPEMLFHNDKSGIMWRYSDQVITQKDRKYLAGKSYHQPIISDELKKLPESKKYIIMITGPPCSGKTTLALKIKRKWESDLKLGRLVHVSDNVSYNTPINNTQASNSVTNETSSDNKFNIATNTESKKNDNATNNEHKTVNEKNDNVINNETVNKNTKYTSRKSGRYNNSNDINHDEDFNEGDCEDYDNGLCDKICNSITESSIIVDLVKNSHKISQILLLAERETAPVLIVEISVPHGISHLFNFLNVQKSQTSDITLQPGHLIKSFYDEYEKISYDDEKNIHHVKFPLNMEIGKEYWYEYSY